MTELANVMDAVAPVLDCESWQEFTEDDHRLVAYSFVYMGYYLQGQGSAGIAKKLRAEKDEALTAVAICLQALADEVLQHNTLSHFQRRHRKTCKATAAMYVVKEVS